jgi:hypothetical protein
MAPPTFKKIADKCDKIFKGFDSHTEIKGETKADGAFPKQGGTTVEAVAAFDKKGKDSMSFEYTTALAPAIDITGKWETERAVNQNATASLEHTLSYKDKCCGSKGYSIDVTHVFGEKAVKVEADYVTDKFNFNGEHSSGGLVANLLVDTGVKGLLAGAKVSTSDFAAFKPELGASYAVNGNTSVAGLYNVNKGTAGAKIFYKPHASLSVGAKVDFSKDFSPSGVSAGFDYKIGKDNVKVQADLLKNSGNVAYKFGGKYTFTAAAASFSDPSNLVCGFQVNLS